ncbi:MAG TPA: acyl-CoA dehydrogenase family protein [Longimicrobiaceae bacterium]|jgi:alkylation response protein AidB-like acyl-CoA dehydrogenase|nr:acyl-CoA dehydrogenase family protein [Longimicrobiaceae bacterium]
MTTRPDVPARDPRIAEVVREHVAPLADAWERERVVPYAAARALARARLLPVRAHDAAEAMRRRLELAALLGRTGSLGTALTVLHAVSAPLAVLERLACGTARELFLEPARAGDACGAVAFPVDGARRISLRTVDGGVEMDGVVDCVAGAAGADFVLVAARFADAVDAGTGDADALVAVRTDEPGVTVDRRATVGLHTAALGPVRLERCRVDAAQVARGPRVAAALADAAADERLLLATAVIAAMDATLRRTLAFVGTRAFGPGVVLGDQQAVRHRLADLMAEHDVAAAFQAEVAAARLIGTPDHARCAMLAIVAAEAAQKVVEGCMQLSGARGFMEDDPATRIYRDLLTLPLVPSLDPATLESEVERDVFGSVDVDAPVHVSASAEGGLPRIGGDGGDAEIREPAAMLTGAGAW